MFFRIVWFFHQWSRVGREKEQQTKNIASKSDEDKFDLARKLKKKIGSIRETYEKELNSEDLKTKQLATALYFIDNLALRVGGKKDSKEEADTVGVTSLRVEHLLLLEDNTVKLDFLGKDSVRFCKKINVHKQVYINLQQFCKNKPKKEELFDLINSSTLNEYLDSFLKGSRPVSNSHKIIPNE
jgi:DNA topoisomerase-1